MERTFHVYIMASGSGVIYVGVTGGIASALEFTRWTEQGFTKKYKVTETGLVRAAFDGTGGDCSGERDQEVEEAEEGCFD